METFSALLARVPGLRVGIAPVTGEFIARREGTRGFDILFDLRLVE